MQLDGYMDFRQIHKSQQSIVYFATRIADNAVVCLKTPAKEFPTSRQLSSLNREYEILGTLDIEGVPRAYDFVDIKTSAVLVTERLNGGSLRKAMETSRIDFLSALHISIGLSRILGKTHRQFFCHRDISPDNILWNPETNQVMLIDFGSALEFPHKARIVFPHSVEGSRAYMSPEQSGRMNRGLDYRTDFYSLGVVLYELFTGRLPFTTTDPNALIHSHIALQPDPLTALAPSLPPVVSDIVLKLMGKDAKERYHSGEGLCADLERCLEEYEKKGRIDTFSLGGHDLKDRFIIPEKLYGRSGETGQLLNLFETVEKGTGHLVFISGKSGIGKTSLVREVYKPLAARGGYIVRGKFDQFIRHQPYSAMFQAFSSLIKQIMGESVEEVTAWKEKILKAIGANGRVLIDMVPELELLIGAQPMVPKLSVAEESSRFNTVILNLMSCFGGDSSPLVMFLDDMQWIDRPSLSLLEVVAPVLKEYSILIIGAYRSNEVSSSHPLMLAMPELQASPPHISSIELEELDAGALGQLLKDTLALPEDALTELNETLFEKTRGNPLFFKTMLGKFHSDRHLFFDYESKAWVWNRSAIATIPYADNVVEMLQATITTLPGKEVELLQLAGTIGSRFDLNILSRLAALPRSKAARLLKPAVSTGLIQPLDDDFELLTVSRSKEMPGTEFRFSHDRIQQAVYDMIPDAEKAKLHWVTGGLLLEAMEKKGADDRLFDAVEHLNRGRSMARGTEKETLVRLNLKAGKKAKKSAAFSVAETCLSHAVEMLEENCWDRDHDFSMELHLELAEACYLVSAFGRADDLYALINTKTRTNREKLTLCNIQAKQYHHQGLYQKAVDLEYRALRLLGYDLPGDDDGLLGVFAEEKEKIEKILAQKDFEVLYLQDEIKDPNLTLAHELFFDAFTDGYLLGRGPLLAAVAATSARLSMTRGNCPMTSIGYICYATILCSSGAYREGHAIGRLAIRMADKYQVAALKNYTYHVFALGINHWLEPLKTSYTYWHKASKLSLESGSPYAGWVFLQLAHVLLASGAPLEQVEEQARQSLQYLQSARMNDLIRLLGMIVIQPLRHLRGETRDFTTLDDFNFSTQRTLEHYKEAPFFIGHMVYSMLRSSLLARDIQPRQKLSQWLSIIEDTVQAQIIQVDSCLYVALHLSMGYRQLDEKQQQETMAAFDRQLVRFKGWAELCPVNFRHKYILIKAEKARLTKKYFLAMDFYEQAREAALESDFLLDAALADELAGLFWEELGKKFLVRYCMERAMAIYERWGAAGKVSWLKANYPALLEESVIVQSMESTTSCSISTDQFSDIMDFRSVIKASQAISQHMVIDKLAVELLNLAVENAGATKGILILKFGDDFWVSRQVNKDQPAMDTGETNIPFHESADLSPAIVRYVINSGESVVFNDQNRDEQFGRCHYLNACFPKSIGCVPIVRQKEIVGLFYLENSQLSDAFKKERMELLRIIASQSAISLENARIYQELEQMNQNLESLVTERTRELNEINQELNAKNHELEILSTTDQLTGLFNRRYIEDQARVFISQCERFGHKFSVFMLDIDHFKLINDRYGHDVGDEVLINIAGILKESIRKVDVAGRWGGEEFLVLLRADGAGAVATAEKLRRIIMSRDHGKAGSVTASFGVSQYNGDDSIDSLVKRADQGLYQAKEKGRNRVEIVFSDIVS
ncbi:MAG: diguanylate cyclase [Desulfobacteraceae bacterium]|nr:diguanylate cyclase [Desulfobacteraceae bacterium]